MDFNFIILGWWSFVPLLWWIPVAAIGLVLVLIASTKLARTPTVTFEELDALDNGTPQLPSATTAIITEDIEIQITQDEQADKQPKQKRTRAPRRAKQPPLSSL